MTLTRRLFYLVVFAALIFANIATLRRVQKLERCLAETRGTVQCLDEWMLLTGIALEDAGIDLPWIEEAPQAPEPSAEPTPPPGVDKATGRGVPIPPFDFSPEAAIDAEI